MLLEGKGITKSFGNIQALLNVNFEVDKGASYGIAGPNGAGKSTLFNVIAGTYPLSKGKVIFNNIDITRLQPHQICRHGLARSFQTPKTFSTMTVFDNIRVGATFGHHRKQKDISNITDASIAFFGLEKYRNQLAGTLDLYPTKLLGLAMIQATDCELLMLDEPLAGLAINEVEALLQVFSRINREKKVTLIIIEHILDVLIELSDHVLVLDNGSIIYSGSPAGIREDMKVIECYLGKPKEKK